MQELQALKPTMQRPLLPSPTIRPRRRVSPGGLDVVAISLWDTKESAEAYKTAGYPEVLKMLDKVLDGTPKVQVSDVISSTIHKPAAVAA
jgi:hypothetical protein